MSRPIETHSALVNRSRSIKSAFLIVFSGPQKPGARKKVIPEQSLGRDCVLADLKHRFDSGDGPVTIFVPERK